MTSFVLVEPRRARGCVANPLPPYQVVSVLGHQCNLAEHTLLRIVLPNLFRVARLDAGALQAVIPFDLAALRAATELPSYVLDWLLELGILQQSICDEPCSQFKLQFRRTAMACLFRGFKLKPARHGP